MTTPPAQVVRHLIEEVLDARDGAGLAAMVSAGALPDCARLLATLTAFPEGHLIIEDMIAEDELVAARMTLQDTHPGTLARRPPTDQPVSLPVFATCRVSDGGIAEAWLGWDEAYLRAQIEASEPVLDMDEIQGNVFPGFNKDHVALLGFLITEVLAARKALGKLADDVATATEVFSFNRLFAAARARRGREGTVRATWRNAALSFSALRAFAADAEAFADAAFRNGMHARSLNGMNDLLGEQPDLLVIIAADDENDLSAAATECTDLLVPGFALAFDQRGNTLPGALCGHEHFGFRDGISQPGIRGRLPTAPHSPVTARLNPLDAGQGKPGQELLWPGEFVFGYAAQDASYPGRPGPVCDAGPEWARNGSFLVYARFRQNVGAFRRFTEEMAARLSAQEPGFSGISADHLGAMLMGRWCSGAPLVRAPGTDDPALGSDGCANNNFSFRQPSPPLAERPGLCDDHGFAPSRGDPEGLACPLAAHIRKANPRDDLRAVSPGEVQRHRLLRRGIPYGPPGSDGQDRGLLFLSYQTSIERQFEFLFTAWLGESDLREAGEGVDVIVGPGTVFGLRVPDGDGHRIVKLESAGPFSRLTGGGYFFAPSVSALRQLADPARHER